MRHGNLVRRFWLGAKSPRPSSREVMLLRARRPRSADRRSAQSGPGSVGARARRWARRPVGHAGGCPPRHARRRVSLWRWGSPRPDRWWRVRDWEDELIELVARAGDEFLVGGYSTSTRRTGHLTERQLLPTGHPRLVPARLRSTWLLTHLRAGTRLPELCRAAAWEVSRCCRISSSWSSRSTTCRGRRCCEEPCRESGADRHHGRPTHECPGIHHRPTGDRRSGLVEVLAPCIETEVGRPRLLGLEALLVVFQLNALHRHHQAHLVEAARILNALTDEQGVAFSITSWNPDEAYDRVERLFVRLCQVLDSTRPASAPPISPMSWHDRLSRGTS